MIKLAKKIISKPNPYYDNSGLGRTDEITTNSFTDNQVNLWT